MFGIIEKQAAIVLSHNTVLQAMDIQVHIMLYFQIYLSRFSKQNDGKSQAEVLATEIAHVQHEGP